MDYNRGHGGAAGTRKQLPLRARERVVKWQEGALGVGCVGVVARRRGNTAGRCEQVAKSTCTHTTAGVVTCKYKTARVATCTRTAARVVTCTCTTAARVVTCTCTTDARGATCTCTTDAREATCTRTAARVVTCTCTTDARVVARTCTHMHAGCLGV